MKTTEELLKHLRTIPDPLPQPNTVKITDLPESLTPFATNHDASSAYRITMSPHEWEWTQKDQEAMAWALILLDGARQNVRGLLEEIYRHAKRSCHIEKLAAKCFMELGFSIPARTSGDRTGWTKDDAEEAKLKH